MDCRTLIDYCLSKPGAIETYPFGPRTTVIKVGGRMFAFFGGEGDGGWINLKCDPDTAVILRTQYNCVVPGYHMDKDHWNTVMISGSLTNDEFLMMVDMSYDLVVEGLPNSAKKKLSEEER